MQRLRFNNFRYRQMVFSLNRERNIEENERAFFRFSHVGGLETGENQKLSVS